MRKLAMLVVATAFMFGITLNAQNQNGPNRQNCSRSEFKKNHNQMATPQMRADRLAKELELNETETAKVKALIEKQDAARIKDMDEMQKVRKEFRAKAEKQKNANEAELEKIIGKEKFEKMLAKRTERIEMAKQKKGMMNERREGKKGKNQMNKAKIVK